MNKTRVNNLCPCGSNKKYKKCYMLDSEACSIYIKEKQIKISKEFEGVLQEVLDNLLRSTQELNQLFYKTQEDDEIVSSRMQMIGIFTVIDVLGNYLYEYLGITGKPSERFDNFIDNFCFVNENIEFSNRRYLKDTTTEELRRLRDSIVHFYGLGKNTKYTIISNTSRTNSQKDIDSSIDVFRHIKNDIVFVQPIEFKKIIIEGSILMLFKLKTDVLEAKSDGERLKAMNGIKRIQNKLREEGASFISTEMAKTISEKISLNK